MPAARRFFDTPTIARLLIMLGVAACPLLANATLAIESAVGGAPTGVHYANFDDLTSAGGSTGGLVVTFGAGGVIDGGAPPYISNSNGLPFGDTTVSGPDRTTWLYAGGTVTLTMPGDEKYLGLLWGSVDPDNSLSFYAADNSLVGVVTGTDVTSNANGNQGVLGTYYVNIDSTQAFAYVVARGGSFEFDNVSYNETVPSVPEPSTTVMLLGGLLSLPLLRRRRGK